MKIAPVAEVKARFSSYLEQCGESPLVVTKNGRPIAVLIGVGEEDDLERLVLAHTPTFRQLVDAAEGRITSKTGLDPCHQVAHLTRTPVAQYTPATDSSDPRDRWRRTNRADCCR